jgi:hemoglobin
MGASRSPAVVLVAALLLAGCAAAPRSEASLYQQLGGRAGIASVVDALLQRSFADAELAPLFAANTVEELTPLITDQLCEASGGPCRYVGRSMQDTHRGLAITDAQFDRFVSHLLAVLDEAAVPAPTQQALLALLSPMRPDIVGQ